MARPGFVHEVNDRTPPLAVHHGTGVVRQSFPVGTSVVYAAEPAEPRGALRPAARAALTEPLEDAPLADRLRPGMRLTIAFGDTAGAVPPMRLPDVRGQLVEEVLTVAAAAGVDDVALVCARGLQRRLTEAELVDLLGVRVFESFAPLGLVSQHDAEADDLVEVAGARVNARVAGSDLVVTVQATDDRSRTGAALLTELTGAADLATVRGHEADPGAEAALADRLAAALPVFAVEVALDTHPFAPELGFLATREWEWKLRDQGIVTGLRTSQRLLPDRARATMMQRAHTEATVLAVNAGGPGPVGAASAAALLEQHRVGVPEQVRTLVTGLPHVSPYGVGGWLNPLLSTHLALHDAYGSHTGTPLVADGGALIVFGSLEPRFHRHHIATADFFTDVLADGTGDAHVAAAEQRFADDEWYRHLYRHSEAHHARQPFQLWYATAEARRRLSDIIWVGGDRQMCAAMGFRAASTLADALEMVGSSDGLGYLHSPPLAVVDLPGAESTP